VPQTTFNQSNSSLLFHPDMTIPSSSIVFSASSLPLIALVPFVNAHWCTNLFDVERWRNSIGKQPLGSVQDKVDRRIGKREVPLPKSSKEFLLCLTQNVDDLSHSFAIRTNLAADIGLSAMQPMTGYPTIMSDRRALFYPFMSAITLYRFLWAVGCSGLIPNQQWLHPFSS
jgi:hypothetical protein